MNLEKFNSPLEATTAFLPHLTRRLASKRIKKDVVRLPFDSSLREGRVVGHS